MQRRLVGETRGDLLALLAGPGRALVPWAIEQLGGIDAERDDDVVLMLKETAADGEQESRIHALRALGRLGKREIAVWLGRQLTEVKPSAAVGHRARIGRRWRSWADASSGQRALPVG